MGIIPTQALSTATASTQPSPRISKYPTCRPTGIPIMSQQQTYQVPTDCPAVSHLTPDDRSTFVRFSSGPAETPTFPTVIAAFEHNAHSHPDLIAAEVVGPDGNLQLDKSTTYAQLNEKAERLATSLRHHGVSNGDCVGLFLARGVEMLVGIIASLKVGAAYIPQDARVAPARQLLHVVDASNAPVVLTTTEFEEKLPAFGEKLSVIAIDDVMARQDLDLANSTSSVPAARRPAEPADICYIIFTSGTTGVPKGVQVTHRNVANVLMTAPMNLGMAPGVRVSQILSISFDMGAWEILGALSNAATLVIRHRSISDAVKLADVVISTPTVLGTLDSSQMRHIKRAAVAGEPCPLPLADEWGAFCDFYNSCGPTETTIVNTAKLHSAGDKILTIGKPTPNNTVYVLESEDRTALAIGEIGEMWAGGACVSAGYLGRPELSAEKYVYDPFLDDGRSMMYKTGDLGRWNSEGDLEHFGRVDDQVKIKGFRVELDGVSSTLETAPSVQKAVALKAGNGLVAFVTPSTADEKEAKDAVRAKLPYYCVPPTVISLAEFPKTGNGKVDKKVLATLISDAKPLDIVNAKEMKPLEESKPLTSGKAVISSADLRSEEDGEMSVISQSEGSSDCESDVCPAC